MRLTDEMDRLILAAVCDDFMTLEFIVGELSKKVPGISGRHGSLHLQAHLLNLISDKLINAYLLHAEPPYITPIEISYKGLAASWFYITQRGRKCLRNSADLHATVPGSSTNSPDENEYTSAVNF